ncbi:hypothetical protein LUZ60_005843 [Juncus effusus]|nr:hypothetical protein LUZ60_005843 [Juncus effusus]
MGGNARDLLRQLSAPSSLFEAIKQEKPPSQNGTSGEVELSLGLSLNGSFGVDPLKKLIRSSSVACFAPAERERPLVRMSSLPSEEIQVLRRLEAKRKRLERRNSLNKNGGEKCEEELGVKRRKVEGECENMMNGKITGRVDSGNGSGSQAGSSGLDLSAVDVKPIQDKIPVLTSCTEQKTNSALQASINNQLQPDSKRCSSISPSSSFLTGIPNPSFPNPGFPNPGFPNPGKRIPGRAHSFSVVERNVLHEMPCVSTKGEGPNGKKVEGFLYKYKKGEEVRIVCVCHGRFLTPAEFVRHAGGGDVAHPLRHITVSGGPSAFA